MSATSHPVMNLSGLTEEQTHWQRVCRLLWYAFLVMTGQLSVMAVETAPVLVSDRVRYPYDTAPRFRSNHAQLHCVRAPPIRF